MPVLRLRLETALGFALLLGTISSAPGALAPLLCSCPRGASSFAAGAFLSACFLAGPDLPPAALT